jgi:hypothetical protein
MDTEYKIESIIVASLLLAAGYGIIGVGTRVDEIKAKAPADIEARGWKIKRYEGYQWGSYCNHGGKVWYHVEDVNNPNVQYRVYVTKWGNELHYTYNEPEKLSRIEVKN